MEAFIGTILPVGFNFAPAGWQQCNGQTLPISQYAALFGLLGTTYGGNGTSNFQLPNLQGRVPMHQGNGAGLTPRVIGEFSGSENTQLLSNNLPLHNHPLNALATAGTTNVPASGVGLAEPSGAVTISHPAPDFPGITVAVNAYASGTPNTPLAAASIGLTGGNVPISILQPYLVINFVICLEGIYPTRN
jgi:microcystin-dependent protein